MEYKSELIKLALTAFTLAATSSIDVAAANIESGELLLAAGCPSHGCPSKADDKGQDESPTGTSNSNLTEAQLLDSLDSQGKKIYQNLDPEAKALAIQLASVDPKKDPNLAVREAFRRMGERRSLQKR